jgi:hypothetical protein
MLLMIDLPSSCFYALICDSIKYTGLLLMLPFLFSPRYAHTRHSKWYSFHAVNMLLQISGTRIQQDCMDSRTKIATSTPITRIYVP